MALWSYWAALLRKLGTRPALVRVDHLWMPCYMTLSTDLSLEVNLRMIQVDWVEAVHINWLSVWRPCWALLLATVCYRGLINQVLLELIAAHLSVGVEILGVLERMRRALNYGVWVWGIARVWSGVAQVLQRVKLVLVSVRQHLFVVATHSGTLTKKLLMKLRPFHVDGLVYTLR